MNHKSMLFAVLGSCLGLTVGLSACGDKKSESPAPVKKADFYGFWNLSDEEAKSKNTTPGVIEIKEDDSIVLYVLQDTFRVSNSSKLKSEGDQLFIVGIDKDGKIIEKPKVHISLKSNNQEMLFEDANSEENNNKEVFTFKKMTREAANLRIEALKKMGEEIQKANGDAEKKNEETGAVAPETKPEVKPEIELESKPGIRKTETGFVFIRDTSVPALGEAWRDPSGMIWGDIVKNPDGSIRTMYYNQATEYCASIVVDEVKNIRAQLPSRGNTLKSDFVRLREYMGARSGSYEGYIPQVLPNLEHVFWSILPDVPNGAYPFYGRGGAFGYEDRSFGYYSVRCVVPRR